MRKIINIHFSMSSGVYLLCMLMITAGNSNAQQSTPAAYDPAINKSYIRSWDAAAPENNANTLITRPLREVKQTTQYIDGLGRPLQTVAKEASFSPNGTAVDMVSAMTYDEFGREIYKYLPFAANNSDGNFKLNPFQQQATFMQSQYGSQNETWFYSQTNFEASPLNRVEKSMAPGNSWVGASGGGRGVEMKYWLNTPTDAVRIWTVNNVTNDFGTYTSSGTYPAGELYKNVSIDENGKQVIEFKDKQGQVIFKKAQLLNTAYDDGTTGKDHSGWLCTYYIYDDFGQLRAVIQPKAVEAMNNAVNWNPDATTLNELVFRYEYDARGRMIMKKVPGAGAVYMVYDARDRLVMTQDANLRAAQKWIVTVYENNLNRPVYTYSITDPSNYNNAPYHRSQAYGSISYPTVANYTNELLSETHYDDYTDLPSGLTATLYNSGYGTYLTASSASPEYAEALTQSSAVKGMVTWTKIKVLGTANQFNSSVNIYDEKGRVIQVQGINVTGGLDIITNQYSFSNQLLRSHVKHQKLGGTTQSYDVATKNNYDDVGRVTSIEKNINNSGWKTIASLEYDAVGQLKKKTLGGTQALEELNYTYNIRGWLLGVNKDQMLTANGSSARKFGFELGYDKLSNTSGRNYASAQYNGNISGMIWKSAGDGIRRKYDFSYDNVNRLMQGLFEQDDNAAGWGKTIVNYDVKMGDGINPVSAYDANGNIKQMQQWGIKGVASTQIDNLTYNYQVNGAGSDLTNKLYKVTDGIIDPQTKLGDFKDGTNSGDDYTYDANGNLSIDNNKAISSIVYNYLNLPQTITITGKGSIDYVYDAGGNKLRKIVHENGQPDKTTLYLFGIYENDLLQFLPQEEGRIRPLRDVNTNITGFTYDYFLKDHLGNIRMVLTEEQQQDQYPLVTFEPATNTNEQIYYEKAGSQITPRPGSFYDVSTNGDKVQLLKKSVQSIGAGKLLKVMATDKLHIKVDYYIANDATDNSGANGLNSVLTSLLSVINTGSSSLPVHGQGATITTNLQNSTPFSVFLGSQGSGSGSSMPKAYLNILFFDEQFKFVEQNSEIIQVTVKGSGQQILRVMGNAKQAPKNGYAYIYVSNESNNLVYFDNLQITDERGPILEETHYYPFGLTMSGISSKALAFGGPENKKLYSGKELQNKEFSDGSGLELYDFGAREQDPQLGRWWSVDPLAEKYTSLSPYTFVANNPLIYYDPDGKRIKIIYRDEDGKKHKAFYDADKNVAKDKKGNVVTGKSLDKIVTSLNNRTGDDKKVIETVANDKRTVKIKEVDANSSKAGSFNPRSKTIFIDPDATHTAKESRPYTFANGTTQNFLYDVGVLSPATILLHELGHALNWLTDKSDFKTRVRQSAGDYTNEEEKKVIQEIENPAAIKRGEGVRNNHF